MDLALVDKTSTVRYNVLSISATDGERRMYEIKNYHTEAGNKTVIVGPAGRKYMPVLYMDGGLKVDKVPRTEERYMREPIQTGRQKAMKTYLKKFRAYGRKVGMSKAAKTFLRKATKAA